MSSASGSTSVCPIVAQPIQNSRIASPTRNVGVRRSRRARSQRTGPERTAGSSDRTGALSGNPRAGAG